MRSSLFKSIIGSLLFAVVVLGGYSCSDNPVYPDNYLTDAQVRKMIQDALKENNQDLPFTQWKIIPIASKREHWAWNNHESFKRFEAVYELPELTEFIYEKGLVLGFIYEGEQHVNEVQKSLPYVRTYGIYDATGGLVNTYTENIDFDVQFKGNDSVKPTVAFTIQASDLVGSEDDVEFLQDVYNFRLVMIW